jgi:DNA-binding MarR family transcriptional regulator
MTLGRLARTLQVSPRNITGLVDNLERAGLVERVPDPGDRRSTLARPTAAGSERINSIWKQALSQHLPVTEGFSVAELVELRHLRLGLVLNMKAQLG